MFRVIKGMGKGFSGTAGAPSDVTMQIIVVISAGNGGVHVSGPPPNAHDGA
jgi:hypothetical protein